MPRATLKVVPGVDTNKTPALNELAVSYSNLIRFMPDRSGLGLVQKLGGWTRFIATSFAAPIRAMNAWSDIQFNKFLAIAGEGSVGVQVYSQSNSALTSITPNFLSQDVTVGSTYGITTASNTQSVTLYLPNIPNSSSYVYFPTIINIGNVNLIGPYDVLTIGSGFITFVVPDLLTPISKISATTSGADRIVTVQFSVPHTFYAGQNIFVGGVSDTSFNGNFTISTTAGDVTQYTIKYTQTGVSTTATSFGGNVNARVTLSGIPPKFTTTLNSFTVTVDLVNHGYSVGDIFNVPIATDVGGATISGLYTVSRVISFDKFEIVDNQAATSSASQFENLGKLQANFFVGLSDSTSPGNNFYYGGGIYGEGLYGSGSIPSGSTGNPITATDWTLDNWGSILTACPKNGAIYYWQPSGGSIQNLGYMPNSPIYNTGAFVAMPQRQMIAFGSSFGTIQDPLLVRWCDIEDFSVWQATANNQAGSYRIPIGSKIVGGLQASQQALLWTDLDLWSMTYIGQPYVYSFNKIGANAGLISQKAASQMGGVVYWMSQKQFFRFAGNGVEVIPCPVWDQVFQNLYPGVDSNGNPYTDRIRCAANSQFNEITWYFPAYLTSNIDPETGLNVDQQYVGTGEVNAYVKYNVSLNQWDYGYQHSDEPEILVGRTAWIDQSIFGPPIAAAAATSVPGETTGFYIYQHETSNNADNFAMSSGFTTGYAEISEADNLIFIDQVWPDMKWGFVDDQTRNATVKITFFVTNYPGDTPTQYGPYSVTQDTEYLSVRMRGRLIAIGVSSTDADSFWRLGALRYRFQPDGKF